MVEWALIPHLRTELALEAREMAAQQRKPTQVIHHSDQGCQYTSVAFGMRCRAFNVRPSMGSEGDAYDNAMCESFFATSSTTAKTSMHADIPESTLHDLDRQRSIEEPGCGGGREELGATPAWEKARVRQLMGLPMLPKHRGERGEEWN